MSGCSTRSLSTVWSGWPVDARRLASSFQARDINSKRQLPQEVAVELALLRGRVGRLGEIVAELSWPDLLAPQEVDHEVAEGPLDEVAEPAARGVGPMAVAAGPSRDANIPVLKSHRGRIPNLRD